VFNFIQKGTTHSPVVFFSWEKSVIFIENLKRGMVFGTHCWSSSVLLSLGLSVGLNKGELIMLKRRKMRIGRACYVTQICLVQRCSTAKQTL